MYKKNVCFRKRICIRESRSLFWIEVFVIPRDSSVRSVETDILIKDLFVKKPCLYWCSLLEGSPYLNDFIIKNLCAINILFGIVLLSEKYCVRSITFTVRLSVL